MTANREFEAMSLVYPTHRRLAHPKQGVRYPGKVPRELWKRKDPSGFMHGQHRLEGDFELS